LQQIDEMKQIFTDNLIGTHSESEFALWPRKPTGSLDDAMSQRIQSFKAPSGWSLRECPGSRWGGAAIICNSRDRL
jgi:hypothetical protein